MATRWGSFRLRGVRASDGLHVKLEASRPFGSVRVARQAAEAIVKSTSIWRRVDVLDNRGRIVARIEKGGGDAD